MYTIIQMYTCAGRKEGLGAEATPSIFQVLTLVMHALVTHTQFHKNGDTCTHAQIPVIRISFRNKFLVWGLPLAGPPNEES